MIDNNQPEQADQTDQTDQADDPQMLLVRMYTGVLMNNPGKIVALQFLTAASLVACCDERTGREVGTGELRSALGELYGNWCDLFGDDFMTHCYNTAKSKSSTTNGLPTD